ncbi:MAG: hypothetical protein PVF27_08015, partial [Gemmatimonadales bacterium]
QDPTYDDARARRLVELLRALATRIQELQGDDQLLAAGPELLRLMGDARSELFHYEVRSTYDSPEVAESRRIVEQAKRQMAEPDFDPARPEFDDQDDQEDSEPWRDQGT